MAKVINTVYGTGEWPKDFTEVTMLALQKEPRATKCNDHRTISLIAHTAKIVAKILRSSGVPRGEPPPPRNSEVLTKLNRIPSSMKIHS
jgi:hypothetical protein